MWDEVTIQKIIAKDRQEKAAKRLRRDNVSDNERNCRKNLLMKKYLGV